MAIAKSLAKTVGTLLVVYLCCRYFGEFSTKQSIVLIVLAWLGFGLYESVSALQRPTQSFLPFCVSIYPNWYPLLSDFKLLGNEDEWNRLCEAMNKVPATEYSVFRSGIFFTVIAPPSVDGLLPGLTYLSNHKDFVSKVEIFESIVNLEHEQRNRRGQHPFFNQPLWANLPELFFKFGTGGYEIGLEVQHEWWEQLCEAGQIGELAKTKSHRDYACGTTRLTVATLPYSEFGIYYQRSDYKRMTEQQDAREKQLEARGWKRRVERDSEIRDPWLRIDHKYFAIAHRDV